MDESSGWVWAAYVGMLSFMAVGGGLVALTPELQRFAVETHGWLTREEFAASFTIAQAAPGPNMLYITLIGWQLAGVKGALAATAAILVPSLTITLVVVRWRHRFKAAGRFSRAVREGLAPLATGLFLATGWVLFRSAGHDWRGALVAVVTALVIVRTRINPIWPVAFGALIGGLGLL